MQAPVLIFLLALLLPPTVPTSLESGSRRPTSLHLLSEHPDAVCLDGSPGAFYYSPSKPDSASADTWVIFLEGGGWCFSETDCSSRAADTSFLSLGSTSGLAKFPNHNPRYQQSIYSPPSSQNCDANPVFCEAHHVYLVYCDGNSFSGGGSSSSPLHYKGKFILDASIAALLDMGLSNATSVLISGDSAGGLATILHADQIAATLAASAPKLERVKALPMSGFFPPLPTTEGSPVFAGQMESAFHTHNSSAGVPALCLEGKKEADKWKCNTSPDALAVMTTPLLLLNSAYDAWSTSCIYTLGEDGACGGADGWGMPCVGDASFAGDVARIYGPAFLCSREQVGELNEWRAGFLEQLRGTGLYERKGSGAFLHSCHTHTVGWVGGGGRGGKGGEGGGRGGGGGGARGQRGDGN
jgi:hypothetical protein